MVRQRILFQTIENHFAPEWPGGASVKGRFMAESEVTRGLGHAYYAVVPVCLCGDRCNVVE